MKRAVCILRPYSGAVRQILTVQSPPTGLHQSVCRARVTPPILQIEKPRPREAWQGAAWEGKRRRGHVRLLPTYLPPSRPSRNKHPCRVRPCCPPPASAASCSGTTPLTLIRTQLLSRSPFPSLFCGLPPTHVGYLRRSSGLRNLPFARDAGILKGALEV